MASFVSSAEHHREELDSFVVASLTLVGCDKGTPTSPARMGDKDKMAGDKMMADKMMADKDKTAGDKMMADKDKK